MAVLLDLKDVLFKSAGFVEGEELINQLLSGNGRFLVITGEVGVGKTTLVREGFRDAFTQEGRYVIVYFTPFDGERVRIGTIVDSLIYTLGEHPRRSWALRDIQLRRLLGTEKRNVILIIDEAHSMHRNTLRALKRLLEISYGIRQRLLSLVLVGQKELEAKIRNIPELEERAFMWELPLFTKKEAKEYLEKLCRLNGFEYEEDALEFLAKGKRTPLALRKRLREVGAIAYLAGSKITLSLVAKARGEKIERMIKEKGVTQRMLAKEAGISESALSEYIAGKYTGDIEKLEERIEKAVEKIEKRRRIA